MVERAVYRELLDEAYMAHNNEVKLMVTPFAKYCKLSRTRFVQILNKLVTKEAVNVHSWYADGTVVVISLRGVSARTQQVNAHKPDNKKEKYKYKEKEKGNGKADAPRFNEFRSFTDIIEQMKKDDKIKGQKPN